MFNLKSNTAFNKPPDLFGKIDDMRKMHETMSRLYEAALALKGIDGSKEADGASAVAALLNMSPQVLKNWESRGVSAEGAIKAEEAIGCRAAWVYSNHGEMGKAPPHLPVPLVTMNDLVSEISRRLAGRPEIEMKKVLTDIEWTISRAKEPERTERKGGSRG